MASAGMPCAAAAAVTSGSFAAPSSIEYSVCTCRCTNDSLLAGLLTWAVLLRVVPARRGDAGRRPVGKTGGARAGLDGPADAGGPPAGAVSILALPEVYSEGLTERVSSSEPPHHRHVPDPGLEIFVTDGGVPGALVEPPGGDLGVQLDLPDTAQDRLPVQLGEHRTAVPAAAHGGVGRHAADRRAYAVDEQPAGGDDAAGGVAAEHVHRGGVALVLLDLRRNALLVDEH